MTEYNLIFTVDGTMRISADSSDKAVREAVGALQCLDCMDAESFDIDGCTVRVTAKITEDAYEPLELTPPHCVEFGQ